MNSPDIWFTLYALAKKGAIHRGINLTTRELGETLKVSQQTASRRILYCFEQGLVSRSHTANGMVIHLTEKGRKELVRISQGLEVAFAPPEDKITIEGQVVEGLGEGAYYVDMYASRIQESLGFVPFSGTLNVRVTDEESNKAVNRMKQTTPLIVKGFSHESRTFGDVICYRIKVNQTVEGVIVIAQRTHHSQNILEVISPTNLRKKLHLRRGDYVTLTVVPLHLVT